MGYGSPLYNIMGRFVPAEEAAAIMQTHEPIYYRTGGADKTNILIGLRSKATGQEAYSNVSILEQQKADFQDYLRQRQAAESKYIRETQMANPNIKLIYGKGQFVGYETGQQSIGIGSYKPPAPQYQSPQQLTTFGFSPATTQQKISAGQQHFKSISQPSTESYYSAAPSIKQQYKEYVQPSWKNPFITTSRIFSFFGEKAKGAIATGKYSPLKGDYSKAQSVGALAGIGVDYGKYFIPYVGNVLIVGESVEMIGTPRGKGMIKETSKYFEETKGWSPKITTPLQYALYGITAFFGAKGVMKDIYSIPEMSKSAEVAQGGIRMKGTEESGLLITESQVRVRGKKLFVPTEKTYDVMSFTPYKLQGEKYVLGKSDFLSVGYNTGKISLFKPKLSMKATQPVSVSTGTSIGLTKSLKGNLVGFTQELGVTRTITNQGKKLSGFSAEGFSFRGKPKGDIDRYVLGGRTSELKSLDVFYGIKDETSLLGIKGSYGKQIPFGGTAAIKNIESSMGSKGFTLIGKGDLFQKISSRTTQQAAGLSALSHPKSITGSAIKVVPLSFNVPSSKTTQQTTQSMASLVLGTERSYITQPSITRGYSMPKSKSVQILQSPLFSIGLSKSKLKMPQIESSGIRQIQKLVQVPILKSASVSKLVSPSPFPPISPIPIGGLPLVFPILPLFGSGGGSLGKGFPKGRQPKRYTPSFTAIIRGIKGKQPKGVETGLRIRPIPKGWDWFKIFRRKK